MCRFSFTVSDHQVQQHRLVRSLSVLDSALSSLFSLYDIFVRLNTPYGSSSGALSLPWFLGALTVKGNLIGVRTPYTKITHNFRGKSCVPGVYTWLHWSTDLFNDRFRVRLQVGPHPYLFVRSPKKQRPQAKPTKAFIGNPMQLKK